MKNGCRKRCEIEGPARLHFSVAGSPAARIAHLPRASHVDAQAGVSRRAHSVSSVYFTRASRSGFKRSSFARAGGPASGATVARRGSNGERRKPPCRPAAPGHDPS
ncbi:hypothetical protein ACRUKS_23260 [Burkholderia pseudomallei]|uniref:hypothetical protein n=1 Tax=Burkholderia TaxID=32008 RepID=UPI00016A7B59|nr:MULTISPECIES: hypothetical protein [Burkholderia]AYX33516.1 hypothetical protein EGY16_27535 [Burkholderia pseudomallei]MDV2113731.1 hypothetical protein [Burkholderia pseudomallei]MDV2141752.1 hypothetical protein [Burkholderia pseudomallei]MDV2174111.1 hypothetical protein [Burkholderia pseudomallei]MDV2182610.1 hypothetical protein [Burkholderia pseudomallei]